MRLLLPPVGYTPVMEHNQAQAIYKALQDGPASNAEIAKAAKIPKEEAEALMTSWQTTHLWVEPVEGKTKRWEMTDAGRSYFDAYGSEGGSTDGSIKFGEYERDLV